MTGKSAISVAMATLNGAAFVREQLDSLAAQTRRPDELVVCDDGSTDGTLSIVARFAARAPFAVRLVRNPRRLGATANFEHAIGLCRGDVIFLCDQDDRWHETKIARHADAYDAFAPVQLVLNDMAICDRALHAAGATQLEKIICAGYPLQEFVAGCCSSFRSSWRDVVLPLPGGAIAHDRWIGGLAHLAGAAHVIRESLQDYRRHDENVSRWRLSQPRPGGLLPEVRAALSSDHEFRPGVRLEMLRAAAARLAERRSALSGMVGRPALDRSLARIDREIAFIDSRRRLLTRPRRNRPGCVAGHFLNGDYRFARGIRSAAYDLVRHPRATYG